MHVVGGDDVDARGHRHPGQRVVAVPVERIAVVPQLHQHAVAAEAGDEPVERARVPRLGPSRTSAAGTVPLRHPVSTYQLSLCALGCGCRCTGARAARASASTVVRGAPFSPAICASLIARASRAYPTGPSASTRRCSPSGSGSPFAGRVIPSVSSAPKTVGRPSSRAASAKRTAP